MSLPDTPARWLLAALAIAALVLTPVLALAWVALDGSSGLWSHLLATVLPRASANTVIVLLGVGVLVAVTGTGCAWLVTAYAFPGRSVLSWALLLPLAVPTYIVAYTYLDLLHRWARCRARCAGCWGTKVRVISVCRTSAIWPAASCCCRWCCIRMST
jgi:ABC-type Fe3+ transport system, permease component